MTIKLLIDMQKFSPGGPGVFRDRLVNSLKRLQDIKIIFNPNGGFDIELSFVAFLSEHKKPHVLRLDGCYYMDNLHNNLLIERAIKNSQAIIYQSKFSKKMIRGIVVNDTKTPSYVIRNGIDLEYIKNILPDQSIEPGSFVSVSNWRNNKRPNSIIKGFLESGIKNHLYMIGRNLEKHVNTKLYSNNKRIHVLPCKSIGKILQIMKACNYQIHLCYIDSCPNVIVEGLACGLKVLCTNLGGTPELVKDDGVILNIDTWKNKIMKKKDLDKIDKSIIADGIHKLLKQKDRSCRPDLDIMKTAHEYFKVIKTIV